MDDCSLHTASGKGESTGKGSCLESRIHDNACSTDFTSPWQGGRQCNLQLLIQPWICAPGTHYGWVDLGSVEYICPTLLHMASTGKRNPNPVILSPMPYLLGHMLMVHMIHSPCINILNKFDTHPRSVREIYHSTHYTAIHKFNAIALCFQ